MRVALVLSLAASPCLAQTDGDARAVRAQFLSFLGGHGCTLSPDSVDEAVAAGTARETIRDLTEAALQVGEAKEQGAYIVFDDDVCQVRLPDIVSKYTVDDPEIRAGSPYVQNEIAEGCFVEDAFTLFAELEEFDPRAGFEAFITFVGAGIISGDVRFYGTSPQSTPQGFQIVTGPDCYMAPNIEQINDSHSFIADGFADYVRLVGRATECGDPVSQEAGLFAADLQGFDHSVDVEDQPPVNAWLDFEFLFITMAAGWHEGMTDVDRGTPRPPLCHYRN